MVLGNKSECLDYCADQPMGQFLLINKYTCIKILTWYWGLGDLDLNAILFCFVLFCFSPLTMLQLFKVKR